MNQRSTSAAAVEPESPSAEVPLSQAAYDAVLGMLMRGELRQNELVTERQIAEQLGMSRTPVREAVRRLEGERLLERQRSGALVVRPIPLEECLHLLTVRRVLEGEAARLAAGHTPKDELQRLKRTIERVQRLPLDREMASFAESDRDLHILIATASGNPVLEQMIGDLRRRMAMIRFGRLPARRQTVCEEHLAVIDALIAGDGEAARLAMERHIDQVRTTILERLASR